MLEGQVLGKAAGRAADSLDLTAPELGCVIGLSTPAAARLRQGTLTLKRGTKPFELAALLVRLHRSLAAMAVDDMDVARAWLRRDNTVLGGKPVEVIRTITGLVETVAYLDARRAGA